MARLALVAGSLVVCEGMARLALAAMGEDLLAERPGAASVSDGTPTDEALEEAGTPEGMEFFLRHEAIHPFLGFVQDREVTEVRTPRGRSVHRELDAHGFVLPPGTVPSLSPVEDPGSGTLDVAVVGGSMALMVVQQGLDDFRDALAAGLGLGPERIRVRSWAMGGYKQPQQLLAVAYFASLGEIPDVVINLDGYNELVLSRTQTVEQGVTPYFPRAWRWRIEGARTPDEEEAIGKIALVRDARESLFAAFDAPGIRSTGLGTLVWLTGDRILARSLESARSALAAADAPAPDGRGRLPFPARGPAEDLPDPDEHARWVAEHWARSSTSLASLCRGLGAGYYHFLQPNQYVPDSKPLTPRERERAWTPESPEAALVREGYPRLREAGEELVADGVRFVDLTGIFEEMEEESLYVDPCCHVGPEGNRILARGIARVVAAGEGGSR